MRGESCEGISFFFQAEDGIRDAQESRGLGDVYKRQGGEFADVLKRLGLGLAQIFAERFMFHEHDARPEPVSYTHLTLPTIYSV